MSLQFQVAVIGILLSVLATPCPAAEIVFEQAQDPTVHPGISSTLDFTGETPGRRTADNFALTTGASVGRVEWSGLHAPLSSGIDDFRISFYSNEADHPGSLTLATGGSLRREPDSTISGLTAYSMTLTTPFVAERGVIYWISIFNQSPGASWLWNNSLFGDNKSVQSLVPPHNQWLNVSGERVDLGFRLIATPIPGIGLATNLMALVLLTFARKRQGEEAEARI